MVLVAQLVDTLRTDATLGCLIKEGDFVGGVLGTGVLNSTVASLVPTLAWSIANHLRVRATSRESPVRANISLGV